MSFPHPKSREEEYRKEDKSNSGSVLWNLLKRTIDIADDRNAEDDVNPAKNRTFDALVHSIVSFDLMMNDDIAAANGGPWMAA
jgi:hypothetical protein